MPVSDDQIVQLITDANLVDKPTLDKLVADSKESHSSLSDLLIEKNLISDKNLGLLLADFLKMPPITLSEIAIAQEVLNIIPESVARKQKIIAFAHDGGNLKVAMVDPSNQEIIDLLSKKVGQKVIPHLTTSKDLDLAIGLYREDLKKSFDELLGAKLAETGKGAIADAPITEIVDLLIQYAYANRASDLHIEPEQDESFVRFRIDGVLHDMLKFKKDIHSQIISRIKVAAKLKTDEHMSAQDGKMQMKLPEEELDIRVSIVPITKGEKAVLRLLSSKTRQLTLGDLGISESDLSKVRDAFNKPFGMVLATGPTGSGKTTSIYAILKILNTRDINIASIEDPVEYEIPGVNQIQVNPKTNLTFASGLRSILRQDPNVIFVGEIRDEETADIAVNSAMTGHLVLSTLHTNDSATALPRLIDMNIEPYLVSSTVNLIIGQRLVRKICEKCRYSKSIDMTDLTKHFSKEVLKRLIGKSAEIRSYAGKGCAVCQKTGYVGRIGIFEILIVNDEIKKLINAKADSSEIAAKAVSLGMKTMLEDGLEKVVSGLTTIEEILRATKE